MARLRTWVIAALPMLIVLSGCSGQLGDALGLKSSLEQRLGVSEVVVGFMNGTRHLTVEFPDSTVQRMTQDQAVTRARDIAKLAYAQYGHRDELQDVRVSLVFKREGRLFVTTSSVEVTLDAAELKAP